jgi:tRNA G10  N-methylase Trm11
VSRTDPRVSVPVRLNPGKYPEAHPIRDKLDRRQAWLDNVSVYDEFFRLFEQNYRRFAALSNFRNRGKLCFVADDARSVHESLGSESIDLVVTSPPYVGAQKYIRASSLSIGWLGYAASNQLRDLERLSIGREHYSKYEYANHMGTELVDANKVLSVIKDINPLRAHIASNYLREMSTALESIYTVLKRGGFMVLVVGNNRISGVEFPTVKYVRKLAEMKGFKTRLELVDDIHSRGLMTKRNKTAGVIARESVVLLEK